MTLICPICDAEIKVNRTQSSYRCWNCLSWLRIQIRLAWDRERETVHGEIR